MDSGNSAVTRADLQAAVTQIIDSMSSYVREQIAASEERIKAYVRGQVYEVETKLVRAFADYSSSNNVRFMKLEADASNSSLANTKRLGSLESKISELEMRIIRLETRSDLPPSAGTAIT